MGIIFLSLKILSAYYFYKIANLFTGSADLKVLS